MPNGRRIVLFVEGHTEHQALEKFFHNWLDPQLPPGGKVGIRAINLKGVGNYRKKLAGRLEQHLQRADVVFGLIDLYGLQDHLNLSGCTTVPHRIKRALSLIRALVPKKFRNRFRQHFAVYEIEAWLLAYPNKWDQEIRQQIQSKDPEKVNDSEPPSKFLKRLIGKGYKKTVLARNILREADPQIAYQKCPYLKEMLDDLLRVAEKLQSS